MEAPSGEWRGPHPSLRGTPEGCPELLGGGEARGQPTVFGTAFVIHTHPASLSGHYFKKYFNPHLTVSFTFFGENDNVGREF